MSDTQEHPNLWAALAAFRGDVPHITHNEKATIETSKGKSFSYKYTTLDHLLDNIAPSLAKHGLSIPCYLDGKVLVLEVHHTSGNGTIRSSTDLSWLVGDRTNPQDLGGVLTYMRRYMTCAALGLQGGEDLDASEVVRYEQPRRRQLASTKPQPRQQPPPDHEVDYQPAGPYEQEEIEELRAKLGLTETDMLIAFKHHIGVEGKDYHGVLGALTLTQAETLIARMKERVAQQGQKRTNGQETVPDKLPHVTDPAKKLAANHDIDLWDVLEWMEDPDPEVIRLSDVRDFHKTLTAPLDEK